MSRFRSCGGWLSLMFGHPEYKPLIATREKAARTQLLIAEGT